jgi:putative restriction endonuclease
MNAYIGNTDYDWYTFLSSRPDLDEVNFWRPGGGTTFKSLALGEPFFFKLKQAHGHRVVGMAFFVMFRRLSVRHAWDLFGESNGTRSEPEMLDRVRQYAGPTVGLHHQIGAILLASPMFLPKELWVDGPSDWKGQIVSGKRLATSAGEGRRIWNELLERVQLTNLTTTASHNLGLVLETERYGKQQIVRPRLGQGLFRLAVGEAYRKCAVTGEHSIPALDAAHIVPYAEDGTHEVSNGLFLRADIHKLYDRGYVTVTPDYEFKVSERLRDEFHNGKDYYQRNGTKIWLPADAQDWPKQENLHYHTSTLFQD